jgi:signal transduction histidine kinase
MQTHGEAIPHVRREIELLRNLVNDLALLAETDEGALHLEASALDLGELADDAVTRWRSRAEAAGLELQLNTPAVLPLVNADRLRISQVLGNLIANAIQHTPSGGKIEVRIEQASTVPGGDTPTGAYLSASVRDTGQGIPEEDLPHVFERFYRVDPSRSRGTGGRGLGLAIVNQIIELHGGSVWAESAEGAGTVIGFALPLENQNAQR